MEYSDEVKKFNSDQQRAIDMAMVAEDYTLILGMWCSRTAPGYNKLR
jgi:hypothetical protein